MRKKIIICNILIVILLSIISCSLLDTELTEEKIQKYIIAYRNLRQMGPEILNRINSSKEGDIDVGKSEFNNIENVIKEAGFKDYAEFVKVNNKIAWGFSAIQGRSYMTKMENLLSEDYPEWKKMLEDPNIPEESKEEIRKTLQISKENYESNKEWATPILEKAEGTVNKKELELIMKYREQLEEVFTGIKLPEQ